MHVCVCVEQKEAMVMSVEGVEGRQAGGASEMTSPEARVRTELRFGLCKQRDVILTFNRQASASLLGTDNEQLAWKPADRREATA